MVRAVYGGRFDPPHNGHLDIARRAADLFDEVIIAVYERQDTLFSPEQRVQLFGDAIKDRPNVKVLPLNTLIVDFARLHGASVLIRGLRGITDFEYEADMAIWNRRMGPGIDSVYLMATPENLFISGTRIREVAPLGYDVSELVPPNVALSLREKLVRRD